MARTPTHHVVLHNGVGPYTAGEVVATDTWPEGTDLERLVHLGAIAPLSAAQARDLEDGDDATQGGTVDPLRTESPPTLPRPDEEGVPETTTPVGGDRSGEPEALDSERAIKREARRRP